MASKSKWFRVAIECATTHGRGITRQDIADMAASFEVIARSQCDGWDCWGNQTGLFEVAEGAA